MLNGLYSGETERLYIGRRRLLVCRENICRWLMLGVPPTRSADSQCFQELIIGTKAFQRSTSQPPMSVQIVVAPSWLLKVKQA